MGKFNYLLGKSEKIKIGDVEYEIKPLVGRHMDLFLNASNQTDYIYTVVTACLQQTDETITEEDVKEMPLSIFQDVSALVMKVNGIK